METKFLFQSERLTKEGTNIQILPGTILKEYLVNGTTKFVVRLSNNDTILTHNIVGVDNPKFINCYKTGRWDGKMSDLLLLKLKKKDFVEYDFMLGHCYEGIIDGTKFFDFYTINGEEFNLLEDEVEEFIEVDNIVFKQHITNNSNL